MLAVGVGMMVLMLAQVARVCVYELCGNGDVGCGSWWWRRGKGMFLFFAVPL